MEAFFVFLHGFGGRHLESKTQQSSCVATLLPFSSECNHYETTRKHEHREKLKWRHKAMFFVDYDIMLAHVSLCRTARLQQCYSQGVSDMGISREFILKI